MNTEAENRHDSFLSTLGASDVAFGVLKYEYATRTKLWKDAMTRGLTWTGIPGLRSIGRGTSRPGGMVGTGTLNRVGINALNKPIQGILNHFGIEYDFVKYGVGGRPTQNRIAGKFVSGPKNINIFGKILGGTDTNFLKIEEAKASQQFLEKNWVRALFSKEVAADRFGKLGRTVGLEAFPGAPGLQREVSTITKLGTRSTAWKFALGQKLIPGAIWASNIAFVAGLTMPLAKMAGQFMGGKLEQMDQLAHIFDTRKLDFGGKIHMSYLNGAGQTERTRALMELQRSRTNARSFIGSEATLYHS